MVKIEIRCPICQKRRIIELDEDLVNEKRSRGVISVNLKPDLACEHSFIAYLDNNLAVRDAITMDFELEIPQMDTVHDVEEYKVPDSTTIDLELIKLNIHATTLINIIRATLLKKPVILLIKKDFLHSHLQNFIEFIFKDSFEFDIQIMNVDYDKKLRKQFKKHIIIEQNKVIHDKQKILNAKNIKIETIIIQKFLEEYKIRTSLIILKNEIQKAYKLAEEIAHRMEELYANDEIQIDIKDFFNNLAEGYNIKISLPYIRFLIDIVENYFEKKIPEVWKFFLYRI